MIDIEDYGFEPAMMPENAKGIPARVTAVHKERYELVCVYGEISAKLKAGIYYNKKDISYPTTGDFVLIQYNESGDSFILEILGRRSKFSRNDFSGHAVGYVKTVKEQVIASNFDYVFIMLSLNNDFNLKRLDRYLTLSWQSGAVPVVILTKSDLVDDHKEQLYKVERRAPGTEVLAVSSRTGYGLDKLSQYLKPKKTIVFLGSSGVGKSSLLNALAGEELMSVKQIREDDSRGRHTTTHRQLMSLPNGAMIIDTPGMREVGMWEADDGLAETFNDVESYFGRCRFSDCAHDSEPGCAVKAAISNGELTEERWASYQKIRAETRFIEDKSGYLQKKTERFKSIAKWNREKKNKRG